MNDKSTTDESGPLKFCPSSCRPMEYSITAALHRAKFRGCRWNYNPWTGERRDEADVDRDPQSLRCGERIKRHELTPPPHDSMEDAQMAARWWPQEAEPVEVMRAEAQPKLDWDGERQPFDGFRPCGITIKQGDWKYGQTVFCCDIYSCPNALCNHKRGCQRATPAWQWYTQVWAEAIGGRVNRKGCELTREQYEALAKAGIAPKLD